MEQDQQRRVVYAGVGLVIGAGVGGALGLVLWQNVAIGAGIGAAVGLLFGAIIDMQKTQK